MVQGVSRKNPELGRLEVVAREGVWYRCLVINTGLHTLVYVSDFKEVK